MQFADKCSAWYEILYDINKTNQFEITTLDGATALILYCSHHPRFGYKNVYMQYSLMLFVSKSCVSNMELSVVVSSIVEILN